MERKDRQKLPDSEHEKARRVLTRRRIGSYVIQGLLFVALVMGVSAYKARTLLEADLQVAPKLVGQTLAGKKFELLGPGSRPTLVYFFAPWCHYCAASTDNIVRLRKWRDESELSIVMVALDWESRGELQAYVVKHELNVPVLVGDFAIASTWQIQGFPSYYVIDSANRIVARDYGYSTQLGLWLRTWIVS